MALNLKKAKETAKSDGDFSPIEEGRFDYIVEAGEEKTASTQTPFLEFTFRCVDPKFENRKVWSRFYLTESAQVFLVRFLEALGLEELLKEEAVSESEIIKAAVGKRVSAYTEIQAADNGKKYNGLKNFTASANNQGTQQPAPSNDTPKKEAKSSLFG